MGHPARRAQQPTRRFLRIRALLAGALVLGVGGSLTLASWTDNEYAAGSFAASTFKIESSVTAVAAWSGHKTAGAAAALNFAATDMSPAVSKYAFIEIRTVAGSTVGGTIVLSSVAAATGALMDALEYRVVAVASGTTCAAGVFSGTPTYTTLSVAGVIQPAPAPAVSSTLVTGSAVPGNTTPGTPVRFCFDVRVKTTAPSSFQGATASVTWLFTGTSNP